VIRTLAVALISGLCALSHPAFAKPNVKAIEPPPCPVDETIRIASAESFSRIESLSGCRENVIVAPADDEDAPPLVQPPVRIRPNASTMTLTGLSGDGPTRGARAISRTSQRTPSIRVAPQRDETMYDPPAAPIIPISSTPSPAAKSSNDAILNLRPIRYATVHDDLIKQIAWRHRVDPLLLHAVIKQESGYRQTAVSHAGAQGLMQIMPATGATLGVSPQHLTNAEVNIDAGARLLRKLATRYTNNFDLVLAAYNAGEGAVQRYGNRIPPYRETQNYVRSVMANYYQLVRDNMARGALR
jgi:Transglycosylase SLT domain